MKTSAGILPFRRKPGLELYLVHMGGPYWRNKTRSWSIVKGEVEEGEDLLQAAKREFHEETGQEINGEFLSLGEVKTSGKTIYAWAVEAEPSTKITSNTFTIEWPPKSGKTAQFPEVDKAAWFDPETAKEVIVKSQLPFLERVVVLVTGSQQG
jgi:predicted NUDIX family NTP pyrophosphohydrolase